MAVVNERHSPAKTVQIDPKTGKPLTGSTPARTASPNTADTALGGEGGSGFFGSFFAAKNKKKAAAMEAPPTMLKASGILSERENIEVEVISTLAHWPPSRRFLSCFFFVIWLLTSSPTATELLISSYYNIVKRTMIDMVPKAVMLNLVDHTKVAMQKELLEHMYRADSLDELLKESDYTVRRRKECHEMVKSLTSASEIVAQVQ